MEKITRITASRSVVAGAEQIAQLQQTQTMTLDAMQAMLSELKVMVRSHERAFAKLENETDTIKVMLSELVGQIRAYLMIGVGSNNQPMQQLPQPMFIQQPPMNLFAPQHMMQPHVLFPQQPPHQTPQQFIAPPVAEPQQQPPAQDNEMRKMLDDLAGNLGKLAEELND